MAAKIIALEPNSLENRCPLVGFQDDAIDTLETGRDEADALCLMSLHEIHLSISFNTYPALCIIQSRLGFRQFLMRSIEKVGIEWNLVAWRTI